MWIWQIHRKYAGLSAIFRSPTVAILNVEKCHGFYCDTISESTVDDTNSPKSNGAEYINTK